MMSFAIRDDVAIDKEKDMAITTWSRPTTIKELQRFWVQETDLQFRGGEGIHPVKASFYHHPCPEHLDP